MRKHTNAAVRPSGRQPVVALLIFLLSVLSAAATAGDKVSFNRDVRPILSDRCFHCHGPDASNQDSEFRLDSREHALADLGGYFGIVPGELVESELHARIHSDGEDRMPPPDAVRGLTESEKQIVDRWILEGARFDKHWAFESIPIEIPVPADSDGWSRTEIDRFAVAKMSLAGLSPNVEASREKWMRRVTFDLTGLPPTLEQIDAFVNDNSDRAFEKVVDRLLSSDACSERLASEWLDVARYSDTYGYQRDDERFVWPYRDWVIRAFADNMPYDRFITWQLAGDLLPDASREQILATAFNRLHSHKKEGGVALEEFRVENVADRTHTVATAFLGLTTECSRCHDHKYDPLTQRDYYSLSSFFANIDERGLISYFTDAVPTPAMPLPTPDQEAELAEAADEIDQATESFALAFDASESEFEGWLNGRLRLNAAQHANLLNPVAHLSFESLDEVSQEEAVDELGKERKPETMRGLKNSAGKRATTTTANTLVEGRFGKAIQLTGDDAVVIPDVAHYQRHEAFSVSLWFNTPEVVDRAVLYRRSRGWDDAGTIGYELTKEADQLSAKLVHFWPGNAICIETTVPLKFDQWHHVVVTYDGSSRAAGLKIYLNGSLAKTKVVADCLTRNIVDWRQGYVDLAIGSRYRDRGFKGGKVDEFQVFDRSLSSLEARHLFDGDSLRDALQKSTTDLSGAERESLRKYYFANLHGQSMILRGVVTAARQRWNAAMDATPAITIMREQPTARPAFVLTRGAYDRHAEPVIADTPEFLLEFPKDAPRNRLGLAQWLTSPEHPLVARVTVNRYWQMIFGEGLVRTPEDFGNQGTPPTHPELLDWLARDFIQHGWDVRRLTRMMVLSSTYRQSSVVTTQQRNKDPQNEFLARSSGKRLSAEMIRDNILAVSGLLVRKVGGPPVKPYDLALAYWPLEVDEGEGLYRRSLYTFWKRTSPAPVMMTMNAGKREVCRVRREVTQSPLQSLALLNGPQFIEAARVLGAGLLQRHGDDVDGMVKVAFRQLTTRVPSPDEVMILRSLFDEQWAMFKSEPDRAKKLMESGNAPWPENVDKPKLAAATVLVNSIMNLNESLRHQ